MDKVLITGGGGFIGANLALRLVNLGYVVTILDSYAAQIHGEKYTESYLYKMILNKVEIVVGSVLDKPLMLKLLGETDYVIHLAAETGTGQSMYQVCKYTDVNVGGMAIILEAISINKSKIKKVLLASSRSIYGEGKYYCENHGYIYPVARKKEDLEKKDFSAKCTICNNNVEHRPTDEESKIAPSSIYAITKYAQEEMLMAFGSAMSIPVVSLRLQNVYGPGQSLSNPYTGILSIFSTNILMNKDIAIFEDGFETRDFVYIDDVVGAFVLALQNERANYQRLNVGTGVASTVIDIAYYLRKAYQSSIDIKVTYSSRVGDIRHNYSDNAKIKSILGFEACVDIEQGLQNFVAWVKGQKVSDNNYDSSIQEMRKINLMIDSKR